MCRSLWTLTLRLSLVECIVNPLCSGSNFSESFCCSNLSFGFSNCWDDQRNFERCCLASDLMSTGSWVGQQEHIYDKGLGMALLSFFRHKNVESVLDLGAGDGSYVQMLRQGGLRAGCFDGNPAVRELSQKRCLQADLSEEHDFGQRWDWVMSIEVAEHVPHVFERTYLNNLERHSCEGIIISWANPFQQGKGHVNGKPWREVQRLFEDRGFWYDANSSASLRRKSRLGWFRQNIMVFERPKCHSLKRGGGLDQKRRFLLGGSNGGSQVCAKRTRTCI